MSFGYSIPEHHMDAVKVTLPSMHEAFAKVCTSDYTIEYLVLGINYDDTQESFCNDVASPTTSGLMEIIEAHEHANRTMQLTPTEKILYDAITEQVACRIESLGDTEVWKNWAIATTMGKEDRVWTDSEFLYLAWSRAGAARASEDALKPLLVGAL